MSAWETAMLSAPADGPGMQVFRYNLSDSDYDFDTFNAHKWSKLDTSAWEQFTHELESVEHFKTPGGGGGSLCAVAFLIFVAIGIACAVLMGTTGQKWWWLTPVLVFSGFFITTAIICCAASQSNDERLKRLSDIKDVVQRHNASTFHLAGYSILVGSESAYFQLIDNGTAAQIHATDEKYNGFNQQPNYNQQQNFYQPGQYNTNPQQYNTNPQQQNYANNVNVNYPSYPGGNSQKMYEMPLIQNVNINPI